MQEPLLVFGCDSDYFPLSIIIEDEIKGFDIELINRISEYGLFRADIQAGEWTSVLKLLKDGKIDAVSGIIKTESRTAFFDFSIPYLTEYYSVFVRDNSSLETIDDLNGKLCVTLEEDAIIETFIIPNGLDKNLLQVNSFDKAFALVGNGLADYVIAPYSMGRNGMERFSLKELELYERTLMTIDYRFAVEKDSSYLFIINEVLARASDEGIIDELKSSAEFSRQFPVYSLPRSPQILPVILIFMLNVVLNSIIYVVYRMKVKTGIGQIQEENKILRAIIDILPIGVSWQFTEKSEPECNQYWLEYSGGPPSFEIVDDNFELIHLPLSGNGNCPEGVVSIAKCCIEQQSLKLRLDKTTSELSTQAAEIEKLKITDQSSGVYNFTYLGNRIKEEIEHYHLYEQKFCIITIEIMERCNNRAAEVAGGLRGVLRYSDIIGYNGNGIIIVILPKTKLSEAKVLLKRFLDDNNEQREYDVEVFELPPKSENYLPSDIRELFR